MSSGLYNLNKVDFDKTLDLTKVKAYGDTMNDGKVQVSFTLPIKNDERGEEAAEYLQRRWDFQMSMWHTEDHLMRSLHFCSLW